MGTMTKDEVKEELRKLPWGILLIVIGFEPYDTETSARRVAEYVMENPKTILKLYDDLNIDTGRM